MFAHLQAKSHRLSFLLQPDIEQRFAEGLFSIGSGWDFKVRRDD